MEKGLKYAYDTIKKYGIKTILRVISSSAWFLLPFIVWIQIYYFLGMNYFQLNWVLVLGFVILAFLAIFFVVFGIQLSRLDTKLMKHIENAKKLFATPDDAEIEKQFRLESSGFIISYLHAPHLFPYGMGNLSGSSRASKLLSIFSPIFTQLLVSYSLFAIFVLNSEALKSFWQVISSNAYVTQIAEFSQPTIQNLLILTIILYLLSLYPVTYTIRKGYTSVKRVILEILNDPFALSTRFIVTISILASLPFALRNRQYKLKFAPFTFPTNLVRVMQQAVENIENKHCNVTKWDYKVKSMRDIELLKYAISVQKEVPTILKVFSSRADPEKALKRICESEPTLYLGLIDNRCAIMCRIEFDSEKKMYRGDFIFDNINVKREFKSIAENVISEQKKLKSDLPKDLESLIEIMKSRITNEKQ